MKKSSSVEYYFEERKLCGAPAQSINNLFRDFSTCTEQQSLTPSQMSLFFVKALTDPECDFLLTSYTPCMPFDQIAYVMCRHFNSDTRKLQLQSEMDSRVSSSFMRNNNITDPYVRLTKVVNGINALAPKLLAGFGDDPHKTRYLLRTVVGLDLAQQTIAQIASLRYTLNQFITALQESSQLREELSHTAASDLHCGQYVNHPRSVPCPDNARGNHASRSETERPRHQSGLGQVYRKKGYVTRL